MFLFIYFFIVNSEEISSRLSPTSETLILMWPVMVEKIIFTRIFNILQEPLVKIMTRTCKNSLVRFL